MTMEMIEADTVGPEDSVPDLPEDMILRELPLRTYRLWYKILVLSGGAWVSGEVSEIYNRGESIVVKTEGGRIHVIAPASIRKVED